MRKCNLLLSSLHTRMSQLRKYWTLMSTKLILKITNKLHAWTTIDSDQGFAWWRSAPCLIGFRPSSIQCSSIICLYLDHLWRLLMHSLHSASQSDPPRIALAISVALTRTARRDLIIARSNYLSSSDCFPVVLD